MKGRQGASVSYHLVVRESILARERGEVAKARRLARIAIKLAPSQESPWLSLAAASDLPQALEYARKALELNPQSQLAQEAVHRFESELRGETPTKPSGVRRREDRKDRVSSLEDLEEKPKPLRGILLALAVPVVLSVWLVFDPADAGRSSSSFESMAKATWTATSTPLASPTSTPIPGPDIGTTTATVISPTADPTAKPTPAPTRRPRASKRFTYNPDELASEGRWIDVDLSRQRVTAYYGSTLVREFVVSTGRAQYPTVTGQYRIYIKLRSTTMSGPGYYLPGVPYTMYFYQGYGLHGTYWHSNFGRPMSHGCINLRTPDAKWLFKFASKGTLVNIHP